MGLAPATRLYAPRPKDNACGDRSRYVSVRRTNHVPAWTFSRSNLLMSRAERRPKFRTDLSPSFPTRGRLRYYGRFRATSAALEEVPSQQRRRASTWKRSVRPTQDAKLIPARWSERRWPTLLQRSWGF